MSKLRLLLCSLPALLILAGCDGSSADSISKSLGISPDENMIFNMISGKKDSVKAGGMDVLKVTFAADYRTFDVNVKMTGGLDVNLSDTIQTYVRATEYEQDLLPFDAMSQPVLTGITNVKENELADSDIHLLALVDLTVSEEDVKRQKEIIESMRSWFAPGSLYLAFMKDREVTESVPASDYVMANYFKPSKGSKLLYRSILCKKYEVEGKKSEYFASVPQDSVWAGLDSRRKALLIFSDDKVYDSRNRPIDEDHYDMQSELLNLGDSASTSRVFYIDISGYGGAEGGDDNLPVIQLLCDRSGGEYFDHYDLTTLLSDLLSAFGTRTTDYKFSFANPDDKVYRGKPCTLEIECFDSEARLIAAGKAVYTLGSVYEPVIVNGKSKVQTILDGLIACVTLLVVVWLFGQIVIPFFRYLYFRRKYVTAYNGANMSYNGFVVGQHCYYCKAPFREGDKIVVKCDHAVHEHCWDDNGYKCPEYGPHCKEGSWYYNHHNVFDPSNASFFMKWIIGGILAGLCSWIIFLLGMNNLHTNILDSLLLNIYDLQPGTPEASAAIRAYGYHLHYLPFYGATLCASLTFFMSALAERRHRPLHYCLSVLTKTIVAGLLGYAAFLLGCIISMALKISENTFLVDWLPWTISGFVIAYASVFRTGIKLKVKFIIASVLLGLFSMYAWSYSFFYVNVNSFELMLISYLLYTVGMAIGIAEVAPRSAHYFLKAAGPVKETDIALYKWMQTSPDYRVTIGKSVDCSLQLSWDITSDIAPIAAEIVRKGDQLYLAAVEDGVLVGGRPLKPGERKVLYHGRRFTIGKTVFTYVEKDR